MKYVLYCCDCRVKVTMEVEPYPWGPYKPIVCPVCGQKVDKDSVRLFRITKDGREANVSLSR